jgi:hypothetical protein
MTGLVKRRFWPTPKYKKPQRAAAFKPEERFR